MIPWYRNPVCTFLIGWVAGTITVFVYWLIAVGSAGAATNSAKTESATHE